MRAFVNAREKFQEPKRAKLMANRRRGAKTHELRALAQTMGSAYVFGEAARAKCGDLKSTPINAEPGWYCPECGRPTDCDEDRCRCGSESPGEYRSGT